MPTAGMSALAPLLHSSSSLPCGSQIIIPMIGRTTPSRYAMTGDTQPAATGTTGGQPLRTLAVRIADDLRAQLDVLAQLTGRSTTEEIRLAIAQWITTSRATPTCSRRLRRSAPTLNEMPRRVPAPSLRSLTATAIPRAGRNLLPDGRLVRARPPSRPNWWGLGARHSQRRWH